MGRYENVIIRASAGTGKTFQLSNRFLSLLNAGAPVDQILATTFTRKAAGEILDRVLLRLAIAASDDRQCDLLAQQLDDPSLSRARSLVLLQQLVTQLHRVRICTLDSFFAQIAGSFCLELGLPPGWRIVEELDDRRLRDLSMEEVLRSDTSEEVSRLMHLLTKGEAERSVTELLRSTVDRLYGLFQDTTAEAWQRIPEGRFLSPERLQEAIEQLAEAPLPADKRIEKARQASVEDAREGNWDAFIDKGFPARLAAGETQFYNKPIPPEVSEACRVLLNHARALFLEQLRHQTWATYQLLSKFDGVYQRRKRAARAMRFDDITRILARASDLASPDRLDFRLDSQLTHVLLDEFQDTSLIQWQVIRPFAERVVATRGQQRFIWGGGETSFFCVGDVKQAIYGWRGGRSELFSAIEAHLPGLRRQSLTESYRSAPPVIETVNEVFAGLHRHPNLDVAETAVRDWCAAYEAHTTARSELPGYVVLETAPLAEEAQDADQAHAATVARRVADIVRQVPGKTVGILARRNVTVARLIFELKRLHIDASEEGGNPLTDSAAVIAVLALLRLADHPGDEVARFHIVQSPLGAIHGLAHWRDEAGADRVARDIRGRLLSHGLGEAMRQVVEPLLPLGTRRDATRLQQLVQLAYEYEPHISLRPRDFVRFVEKQRVADPTSSDVRVMTIHQAKGLQFDVVVLAELDEGITGQPASYVVHQDAADQPIDRVCMYRNKSIQALLPADLQEMFQQAVHQEVTESLCVLYVALTRAIHAMHMIIAAPKKKENNLPRTMAGLLRAALTDGGPLAPDTIAYEKGDRHWWRGQAAAQPTVRRERPAVQIKFPDAKRSIPSLRQRMAPSALEATGPVRVRDLLQFESIAARTRGSLIHAWLEQIEWLEDGVPSDETLLRIAQQQAFAGVDIDEELQRFADLVRSPMLQSVLCREQYLQHCQKKLVGQVKSLHPSQLQVHRERRFAVNDAGRLISGIIDRLVLVRQEDRVIAAEIIDFKTDHVATDHREQVEAIIERYRPQQEAYQQAVHHMYQLDRQQVSARLVLLRAAQIHELVVR